MDIASAPTVRATKKTTLSYTQMLQYYTGDTVYGLNRFNSWPLSNGTPVTFGLPWFNSGSPCSAPAQERNCQSHVQRLLRLQPVPAREHVHSDRAAQPELVLAEMAGLQRPVPIQPCAVQHAADGDFQRPEHSQQQPGLQHRGQQFERQVEFFVGGCFGDDSHQRQASAGGDLPLPQFQRGRQFSGSADQLLHRRQPGLSLAAQSRGHVSAHDLCLHSSSSPADIVNEINDQPDRPEHEAERLPGAVRRLALLWSARRIRLEQLHHSAGEQLSGRAGRHLLPQQSESRQLRWTAAES